MSFRDTSLDSDSEGRGPGPKVARAKITSSGVDPHSFKTYFKGEFADSALPIGFDQNQLMSFFSKKGGRSSSLFANDYSSGYIANTYSFAVAKVKNSSVYLGVANDLIKGLSLRLSFDLVNRSEATILAEGGAASTGGPFLYARLANSNGDSVSEIDPQDFYVIGTQNHVVNKLRLKLNNLPSPPTQSGDLNADGRVDIYDYNLLVTGFGNPYTIFDYNTLVGNFGK